MKRRQEKSIHNSSECSSEKFQKINNNQKFVQYQGTKNLKTSIQEYDGKFPYFRQPKEIGCFSKDFARRFHHDKRQLKFYAPPPNPQRCKFDLRHGYSEMIFKDRNIKEYLNNLLRWIMQNRHVFYLKQASSNVSANSQKLDTRNSASCFNRYS